MSFYRYWQKTGTSDWKCCASEMVQQVIEQQQPEFVTALELDAEVHQDMTPDQLRALKYRGDFYADWDCEDIGQTIAELRQWLTKMEHDAGVDPACIDLHATGGRGFHARIPMSCFIIDSKYNSQGAVHLVSVYKEFAYRYSTDHMDMRIYSQKRGRMWRQPGVQRSNGKYKVAITLDEVHAMTAERYAELCSAPRPEIQRAAGVPTPELVRIFNTTKDRHAKQQQKVRESTKQLQILHSYPSTPKVIDRIFSGQLINQTIGLNAIAVQLAILATAIGVPDRDAFLVLCEGFIQARENVQNTTHSTRWAIEAELRGIFDYVMDNPSYGYSVGGLRTILLSSANLNELLEAYSPNKVVFTGEGTNSDQAVDTARQADYLDQLAAEVQVDENGIVAQDKEGHTFVVATLGWKPNKVVQLMDRDGKLLGNQFDFYSSKQFLGMDSFNLSDFNSPARITQLCNERGAVAPGVNARTAQSILGRQLADARNAKQKEIQYMEQLQGYVVRPIPGGGYEQYWVAPDICRHKGGTEDESTVKNYVFSPLSGNKEGMTTWDYMLTDRLGDDKRAIQTVDALLNMNFSGYNLAAMIGWFTACFIKQILVQGSPEFPLLQIFGQAGSGKTQTTLVFLNIFSDKNTALLRPASGSTPYAINQFMSTSTVVPMAVDEYKPNNLTGDRIRMWDSLYHDVYTYGQVQARGGGGETGAQNKKLRTETSVGSILFIAEQMHPTTAVNERSVIVQFNKTLTAGRNHYIDILRENRKVLVKIGNALYNAALEADVEEVLQMREECRSQVRPLFASGQNNRLVESVSTTLCGLKFFAAVIRQELGDMFDSTFESFEAALLTLSNHMNQAVDSEAKKVFDTLALMSREQMLSKDHHYFVSDEGYIDIEMDGAFSQYLQFCTQCRTQPLFISAGGFKTALSAWPPLMTTIPDDSPLAVGKSLSVYRFSLEMLADEGVSSFN